MSFRLLLLGLIAPVLLLAACAPPPELRDNTLLRDDSLVSGEPCAAPCWRGITPGTTSWRDAITILEDDADLENIQQQDDENTDLTGAVFQQKGGQQCCQIVSSEDGATVNLIFLRTAPTNTLGEVIKAHGEPDYVVGTPYPDDDQAIMNLVYTETPMIVFVFVAGEAKGELSENSEVVGVLYTTPKDMDLFMKTNNLHVWEGYDTYKDYEEGEFEVTPSVTLTPTAAPNG